MKVKVKMKAREPILTEEARRKARFDALRDETALARPAQVPEMNAGIVVKHALKFCSALPWKAYRSRRKQDVVD
jgi:hypothetical protein